MAAPARVLRRVVSGGQTGVDQAALAAASAAGLEIGGWCPPGRRCETGRIPEEFPLRETPRERSDRAAEVDRSLRTEWNVRDSDATLLLRRAGDELDPGSAFTLDCAFSLGRPVLACDPADPAAPGLVGSWLARRGPGVLNVAGPSESSSPGIGAAARRLLDQVFGR